MICSGQAQRAFELDKEDPRLRDAYGRDSLGDEGPAGPPAGRGRGHVRPGQRRLGLFRPPRRQRRLEGDREGPQAAPAPRRPGPGDAGRRPRRPRAARQTLVLMMGEFGRAPVINREARPRPLDERDVDGPGRRRPAPRPGHRRDRPQGLRHPRAQGHPAGPRRHRLHPPRHRPRRALGQSPGPARSRSSPKGAGRSPSSSDASRRDPARTPARLVGIGPNRLFLDGATLRRRIDSADDARRHCTHVAAPRTARLCRRPGRAGGGVLRANRSFGGKVLSPADVLLVSASFREAEGATLRAGQPAPDGPGPPVPALARVQPGDDPAGPAAALERPGRLRRAAPGQRPERGVRPVPR